MNFDENEEMEEDEEDAAHQGYDSQQGDSALTRQRLGPAPGEGPARRSPPSTRYRECLKNHALSVGGHAVDGCGEFMAAGEEGTLDALKCAACNCHRNFHRKETDSQLQPQHSQVSSYYRPPPPAGYLHLATAPSQQRPLALPSGSGGGMYSQEEEDVSNPSSSGAGGGRKRFRTKFTAEQKEKMQEFAEGVGWRIRREEEAAVERFCEETGVTRHVLKVWMHNNKNTRGKKP